MKRIENEEKKVYFKHCHIVNNLLVSNKINLQVHTCYQDLENF